MSSAACTGRLRVSLLDVPVRFPPGFADPAAEPVIDLDGFAAFADLSAGCFGAAAQLHAADPDAERSCQVLASALLRRGRVGVGRLNGVAEGPRQVLVRPWRGGLELIELRGSGEADLPAPVGQGQQPPRREVELAVELVDALSRSLPQQQSERPRDGTSRGSADQPPMELLPALRASLAQARPRRKPPAASVRRRGGQPRRRDKGGR